MSGKKDQFGAGVKLAKRLRGGLKKKPVNNDTQKKIKSMYMLFGIGWKKCRERWGRPARCGLTNAAGYYQGEPAREDGKNTNWKGVDKSG